MLTYTIVKLTRDSPALFVLRLNNALTKIAQDALWKGPVLDFLKKVSIGPTGFSSCFFFQVEFIWC